MKRIIPFIVLVLIGFNGFAQSWQWAKNAGGQQTDASNSIATDIHGRIYITGSYTGDTLVMGQDSVINTTTHNAFITKYDAAGNVLWAKGSIGNSKAVGTAITTDKFGAVYVTGTFNSATDTAVIFGNDTLTNIAGNALSGTSDIFVIKYDSTGTILWARRAGGLGGDFSTGIAADNNGNIFVSGYMGSAYVAGDSLNFASSTLYFNGSGNLFLLKYTNAGTPVWARTQGGNGATMANGVATDSLGNIYVTGTYVDSAVTFGSTTLPYPALVHYMFLVKYTTSGSVIWAKSFGGAKDDNALCVATDHNFNVFISGYYKASTTFGTYTLTNTASGNATYYMFIAKFDSAGTALWAKSGTLGTYNFGYGMTTDPMNNVYVTGIFEGGITFDSVTTIATGKGVYVVKYTPTGTVVWAKSAISANPALGYGIAIDAAMNLYVTGYTTGTVNFGIDTLAFHGVQDIFIAKLSNSNVGIPEIRMNTNGIALFPNPNHGDFTLTYRNLPSTNSMILIYDMEGKLVSLNPLTDKEGMETIHVYNVLNGLYFWEVVSNSKAVGTGKMVILK